MHSIHEFMNYDEWWIGNWDMEKCSPFFNRVYGSGIVQIHGWWKEE